MVDQLFLIATTFYLAPVILAASAILICCLLEDYPFLLTLAVTVFAAMAILTGHVTLETITAHPFLIPGLIAGYLVAGVLWVRFAWGSFIRSTKDKVKEIGETFDDSSTIGDKFEYVKNEASRGSDRTPITDPEKLATARLKYINEQFPFRIPLLVREHKARIIRWMALWPFSVLRTLLNDPIRRFYNWAYYRMAGHLQAMADRAFKVS